MVDVTKSHSIASIPDVSLILNETISLVASMRKQARWSTSSVAAILGGAAEANYNEEGDLASRWGLRGSRSTSSENPLLAGFSKLRQDLGSVKDLSEFDTAALLKPFLSVIRSSTTTGPITSLALNSITKFFSYRLINKDSKNLPEAMKALSSAVTHCRFEASDSGHQDEVVLLRILTLMQDMMSGVGGDLLSDESVCEMMETGLSMCCQMRLSEMLRRSAEMTMSKMVQVVFLRLTQLDPADDEAFLNSASQTPLASPRVAPIASPTKESMSAERNGSVDDYKLSDEVATNASKKEVIVPYGITSIRELLRVLISILNPVQRQHTDSMRIMALRIIEVAFEVGGTAIALRPTLRRLATDDLSRHLFQLIRSDNHIVLQSSLRVIGTLLHTMRVHLKLQQELFLNYVVACLVPKAEALRDSGIDPSVYEALPTVPRVQQLTSGRSTPIPVRERQRLGLEGGARGADAREVMIECIGSLIRIPTFMIDLFVNYDCDENLSDLCEDVLGFLCRNAFPDAATWSTTNVPPLCLDALLGYISLVHARLTSTSNQSMKDLPRPEDLHAARSKKELVVKAAAKFNEDPKKGIAFLTEHKIIDTENETLSFARFLFSSGRLNKKLLGDFISKPKNLELLREYIKLFDFKGKRLDQALREMLAKFRLPGEAQQIARIVEEFAAIYFHEGVTEEASADAAYVLSYATIMLNTDQHNPQAKKSKMTSVDFAKNLRGTNNGENFRAEYLQSIYDDIKNNEIIMPEEHDTNASFEYAWKELQSRVRTTGPFIVCETNTYDEAMFRATWKPLLATLTFVFQSATDDAVFARVLGGLDQCARIAAHYRLVDVLDQIVSSLAKMSLLAAEQLPTIDGNTIVEVDKQKITVSELGIAFGRELKAQLATVLLFRICKGNEALLRSAWAPVFDILSSLLINSMLPTTFSPLNHYMKLSPIPLPPPNKSSKSVQRNQESSFFNSLSSYLSSYTSDQPPPPTEEEIESTMCTFDCVAACRLEGVGAALTKLGAEEASALVEYLLEPQVDSPSQQAITALLSQATPSDQALAKYDPALLLKVEVATALCLKDTASTHAFSNQILSRCLNLLREPQASHQLMTERLLTYTLRLYQAMLEANEPVGSDFYETLEGLDDTILRATAVPIAFGLLGCLKVDNASDGPVNRPEVYRLVARLQAYPDAASLVFEIATLLSTSVSESNFFSLLNILEEFIATGKSGAQDERAALLARRASQDKRQQQQQIPPKPSSTNREEVNRACRAIEMIYIVRQEATQFGLDSEEADKYWLAILDALRRQCLNPCKEVAKHAFAHLQRLLSSLNMSSNNPSPQAVFEKTIIPLIHSLLENVKSKPRASEENKVQACALLCNIWLRHLSTLQARQDTTTLWTHLLQCLTHVMAKDTSPYLTEAIMEKMKNVLLVMNSDEMLVPGNALYIETERVLADAKVDILSTLFATAAAPPSDEQQQSNNEKEAVSAALSAVASARTSAEN